MFKHLPITLAAAAAAALLLPAPADDAAAAADKHIIRVATLAPRNSGFMREFQRLDRKIRETTGGKVAFKLYASGVSGDETDMLRKMRAGQLDAAMVTSDGLGTLVPRVNVMRAPGVIQNYKQLEAVQKEMLPEFAQAFEDNGFKLIAWGEAGGYRYFSREPIKKPADIRSMRPWLWPSSPIMTETWRAVGATAVPMGMGEVYGALQTRMVDLVESTAIAYMALQWHNTGLSHVSAKTNGVLTGGWVMNKSTFDALGPEAGKMLLELAAADNENNRMRTRKADIKAYKRLVERGLTPVELSPEGAREMAAIEKQVRERLVGRVYPKDLLDRVQAVAAKHR